VDYQILSWRVECFFVTVCNRGFGYQILSWIVNGKIVTEDGSVIENVTEEVGNGRWESGRNELMGGKWEMGKWWK